MMKIDISITATVLLSICVVAVTILTWQKLVPVEIFTGILGALVGWILPSPRAPGGPTSP